MNTKKCTSKVNYANRNKTLKSVIPTDVAEALDINASDSLKWIITDDNDNITVIVEKLIL